MASKPRTRKTPTAAAATPAAEQTAPAAAAQPAQASSPAKPIDLGTADPATIAARAKEIGDAQHALNEAVAAATAAQSVLHQASTVETQAAANEVFDKACDDVLVAREAFYQLIGFNRDAVVSSLDATNTGEAPDGSPAGLDLQGKANEPADQTAGAASQSAAPATPPENLEGTHNPESDDDNDGEAGNGAGLTEQDADRLVAFEIARLATSVRELAAADPVAAMAHLGEERRKSQLMMSMAKQVDAALAALEIEVSRTETVWPLTTIRFAGAERPIGEPLKVDYDTFLSLTRSGAAADHPPETTHEDL